MARTYRFALLGAIAVLALGAGTAQAKHGADDPAGHNRAELRHGAEDAARANDRRPAATISRHGRRHHREAGDDHGRRGHGADDGANHFRHGKDDAAGDDKGAV